ncbi:MAG: type IV pilus modification protein PilV [Gammaproteobacteria bacterium]|nr:type IV pilus modification protein PilV [Gammaproteobacteria bacterium]
MKIISAKQQLLRSHASQHGFSLLEVLIALLVLSIGLLGLAGLEVFGLKYNFQSYERTQATLLIEEMADRMRANPMGVMDDEYDAIALDNTPVSGALNCTIVNCTPAQFADYDEDQWKRTLSAEKMLAQGKGSVTRLASTLASGAPVYLFQIRVDWKEDDVDMSQTMNIQVLP